MGRRGTKPSKLAWGLGLAAGLLCLPALAEPVSSTSATTTSADKNWILTFSNDLSYLTWRSTYRTPNAAGTRDAGSGSQTTLSSGLQFVGRYEDDWKLQVNIRSGAIWSRMNVSGATTSQSGMTDTSVGSTLTYYGFDGIQPFLSLDTNLPTASGVANRPAADPDISGRQNNGEGTNWGATLGANVPLTRAWVATLAAGYTNRGAYTNWTNPGTVRLDPGDVITLNTSLNWHDGPWSLQNNVTWVTETRAVQDGQDYFQSGNKLTLGSTLGYEFSKTLSAKLNGSWTHIDKNRIFTNPPPAFSTEPFNSNGDTLSLGLSTSWKVDAWTLTPSANLFHRTRDDYDTASLSFVPHKTMASLGLATAYALGAGSLRAGVTHAWSMEGERPATPTPAIDTRAWTLTLGGSWKF